MVCVQRLKMLVMMMMMRLMLVVMMTMMMMIVVIMMIAVEKPTSMATALRAWHENEHQYYCREHNEYSEYV